MSPRIPPRQNAIPSKAAARKPAPAPPAKGKTPSSTKAAKPSPNTLTYRGGAILDKPVIRNIYLGDYWQSAAGKAEVTENDAFATDLVTGPHMSVLAEYGVGKGSFAGSITVAGKPTALKTADIEALLKAQLAKATRPFDPQTIHTVILPPGCTIDSDDGKSTEGLGGFHCSYPGANGKPVYYAVIAYSDTQGNGLDFDGKGIDAVNIIESHEWDEAATDPDVNSAIKGRKLGWYNTKGGEIGDLALDQLKVAQTYAKVDGYPVQKEWSNQDRAFETVAKDPSRPVLPPMKRKIRG
jgi:hypothetical protein